MKKAYRHVFGPVLSRRLGRSLGIDLTPFKTCSFDCVYCQLGATTTKTIERRSYVSIEETLDEIDRKLAESVAPDYITLAGSGEPTLHCELGTFIERVKARWDIQVAVITNGSLLWDSAVRRDVARADLVMPSLDAGFEDTFQRVNRPHPGLTLTRIVEGMAALRDEYAGIIWLELLLLKGISDSDDEIEQLAHHTARIRPDRIHITTVTRPAQTEPVQAVPLERLHVIARRFGESAEVVSAPVHAVSSGQHVTEDDVLDLVRRHPCSMDDVAHGLGISFEECMRHMDGLLTQERILSTVVDGLVIYMGLPGDEGA